MQSRSVCNEGSSLQCIIIFYMQVVETMPQTKEVEDFLKMIEPFNDVVEEKEDSTKGQEKGVEDPKKMQPNRSSEAANNNLEEKVTGGNSDSDEELEFQDSYDNLPEGQRTPLTVSSQCVAM